MKLFTPGPATSAFFQQLLAIAQAAPVQNAYAGGIWMMRLAYLSLPSVPPDPADPEDAAFLHGVCLPLYNVIATAYQADAAAGAAMYGATPQTAPPISVPPSASGVAAAAQPATTVPAPPPGYTIAPFWQGGYTVTGPSGDQYWGAAAADAVATAWAGYNALQGANVSAP